MLVRAEPRATSFYNLRVTVYSRAAFACTSQCLLPRCVRMYVAMRFMRTRHNSAAFFATRSRDRNLQGSLRNNGLTMHVQHSILVLAHMMHGMDAAASTRAALARHYCWRTRRRAANEWSDAARRSLAARRLLVDAVLLVRMFDRRGCDDPPYIYIPACFVSRLLSDAV